MKKRINYRVSDKEHEAIMKFCEKNFSNQSRETRILWLEKLEKEGLLS